MTQKKLRIGLVFGGRSAEHEVSVGSAISAMSHLDKNTYEVVPLAITKEGSWLLGVEPAKLLAAEQSTSHIEGWEQTQAVTLTGDPTVGRLIPVQNGAQIGASGALDVIFPVLHGTYGEDGTLQGLLEMANVPYVGCGVLGSALGMDKEKTKMVLQAAGLPIVDSLTYRRRQWERSPEPILDAAEQRFGYPCFVKPVNLGSSVGVTRAHNRSELAQAINVAAEYDSKILIERAVDCRELACAVLGNDEPVASAIGEIISNNEFFDYNAKYVDKKMRMVIPADIPQVLAEDLRRQAIQAFLALDLNGLARVDFFLDKKTGQTYLNEVNTMPGFTQMSQYPKLWAASGLSYPQLLDRLIELALERHEERQRNRTNL